jgi:hypothetical protein
LEDLIEQIDAIKFNESMFITGNMAKSLKKQESYSQLQQINHKNVNEAIQGKINKVLDERNLKSSNPIRQG